MYIKLFGTTDNYNTEYTERLHIELAKDAWRATNFKDEFPQMTLWLEWKEKILCHDKFVKWWLAGCPGPLSRISSSLPLGVVYERQVKMPKHPSAKAVTLDIIANEYGARYFKDALARYVAQYRKPGTILTRAQIEHEALEVAIPFCAVPVYHIIKFTTPDYITHSQLIVDSAHVKPAWHDGHGNLIPARFDTVLVNDGTGGPIGVNGAFILSSF